MKFFILHGTGGEPDGNWFPWLKQKLEKQGHEVVVPDFPGIEEQSLESWMNTFDQYRDELTDDTVFVAHSVAPAFVLSLLEQGVEAEACFFISAFTGLLDIELDEANKTITDRDFDFEKIMDNCSYFKLYQGSDDPYVPLEKAENLANELNAELEVIEDGGHLNEPSGYIEFPKLLEDIETFCGDTSQELKIRIESYEDAREKLERSGANLTKELTVRDTYFKQPGNKVLKITEDNTGDYLVELEPEDGGFQIRRYEEINDAESRKQELESEYGIYCILEKQRIFYELGSYTFNFNLIDEVGDFLVVEGEDISEEIFEQIGFENPEFVRVPFSQLKKDQEGMEEALVEAEKAMKNGELPIGAVVVSGSEEISRAQSRASREKITSEHAEMVAIRKAGNLWDKEKLTLYTTLQPCIMCLATAIRCGIDRVVYAMEAENEVSTETLPELEKHGADIPEVTAGIKEQESVELFEQFMEEKADHFARDYVKELIKPYDEDMEQIKVEKTDFETVNEAHKQIPEFDEEHLEERYERKCSGNNPFHLVAKKGNELVGYAVCYDKFNDGSYYVWMAGVRPENRREGIMTQIVEKATEIAREKSYNSIKIKTRNERKEMRHFLTDKGFKVCGYNEKETVEESEILHEKAV